MHARNQHVAMLRLACPLHAMPLNMCIVEESMAALWFVVLADVPDRIGEEGCNSKLGYCNPSHDFLLLFHPMLGRGRYPETLHPSQLLLKEPGFPSNLHHYLLLIQIPFAMQNSPHGSRRSIRSGPDESAEEENPPCLRSIPGQASPLSHLHSKPPPCVKRPFHGH